MPRHKLIAANWKMNGLAASVDELDRMLAALPDGVEVSIHPPLTLLTLFAAHARGRATIGAQDVAVGRFGARTGEVSATMLADAGARAAIVGHSERRQFNCETDTLVRDKGAAALAAGLLTILCVGETATEHAAGETLGVIARQLAASIPAAGAGTGELAVAYEPIWAIGSGRTPTAPHIAEVHAAIRAIVGPDTRILYGGSVGPANAAELLAVANVDGALVGGASLRAADFLGVIAGAIQSQT